MKLKKTWHSLSTILVFYRRQLQTWKDLELIDAISYIDKVSSALKKVKLKIGQSITEKFNRSFGKKKLWFSSSQKNISYLISHRRDDDFGYWGFVSEWLVFLKYAPITSVDVERGLSRSKKFLSDKRRHFTFENV